VLSDRVVFRVTGQMLTKMNGHRALIGVLRMKRDLSLAQRLAIDDLQAEAEALMEGCEILRNESGFRRESAREADGCEILRSECGFQEG
jgi:hypothetical protein